MSTLTLKQKPSRSRKGYGPSNLLIENINPAPTKHEPLNNKIKELCDISFSKYTNKIDIYRANIEIVKEHKLYNALDPDHEINKRADRTIENLTAQIKEMVATPQEEAIECRINSLK